jgi:hypothetical protein
METKLAWTIFRNGKKSTVYHFLSAECLRNIPDTEEFYHELTSNALNAALVMTGILEFIIDRDPEHLSKPLKK